MIVIDTKGKLVWRKKIRSFGRDIFPILGSTAMKCLPEQKSENFKEVKGKV